VFEASPHASVSDIFLAIPDGVCGSDVAADYPDRAVAVIVNVTAGGIVFEMPIL